MSEQAMFEQHEEHLAEEAVDAAKPFDECWNLARELAQDAVRECREIARDMEDGSSFVYSTDTSMEDHTVLAVTTTCVTLLSRRGLVGF